MKPIETLPTALRIVSASLLAVFGLHLQAADDKITFQDHILPIMENKCLNCHNPDEAKGGLDLSNYGAILTGGSGGEVAIAEDPLGSRLYSLMAHREEPHMPPKKPKAPEEELKLITAWIDGGLLETASSKARKSDKPKLDMSLLTTTGKPEGPPPMPEHLILQPEIVTERPSSIPAMAHSPWAPILAVAGQKQVLLYHSEDFELLGVLPYPEGFPQALSFSSNGSILACGGGRGGKSGNVVAWDVKTGERVIEVGKEFDIVLGADISPSHKLVVLGGPGRNIKLWNTVTGEQVNSIKKHPDWMLAADFSPDGVLFATGGRNAGLYVWEGESGYEFYTLKGHTKAVTDLAWRADSNVLASCSEDGQIILWEMNEGKQVKKWAAHGGGALSVDFAPDGHIVSCGRDKTVKIWKPDGAALRTIAASDDIVMTVAFTQDSKRVISGDFNGKIAVWNVENGIKLADLNANPGTIDQQLAYSRKRITELTTNLPKLEEGVKVVSKEIADARAKLETVKKSGAEATAKKAGLDKKIAGLNGQIKSLTDQEKPAKDALTAKQADAKKKADAFNVANQARTNAQNEVNKWSAEFAKTDAAAKAAAAALSASRAEAAKHQLDANAQKAMADAIASVTNATNALKGADANIAAKKKAQADAVAKLAAFQKAQTESQDPARVEPLKAQVSQAQTAVNTANQQLAQANAPRADLVNKLNAANAALKPHRDKESAVKAARAKADQLVAQRTTENANAGKNAADTKTQLDAANKKLADANARLKPVQDAKVTADAEVKKANDAYAAKSKALADARAQLAAATGELKKVAPLAENTAKQKEAAEKTVQAIAKKETDARKSIELAKNELETNKYLEKKWQAAAVNLQVKEESEQLDDMEEKLDDMVEEVEEKKTEHAQASTALAEAEKTLASARKTVSDGTKELAEKTTSVLEAILELASTKAAADIREEVITSEEKVTDVAVADPAANQGAQVPPAPIADKPAVGATAESNVETAAITALAQAPREALEKELQALRDRLSKLEAIIQQSYQEATRTREEVAKASQVANTTPKVVAERAKSEDKIEAEVKKVLTEKEQYEANLEAQRKRIEELRKKYLDMIPTKEG